MNLTETVALRTINSIFNIMTHSDRKIPHADKVHTKCCVSGGRLREKV